MIQYSYARSTPMYIVSWIEETIYLFDYITQHLYKGAKDIEEMNLQKKEIFWAICVYRLLNKVETFEKIGIISWKDFGSKKKSEAWFQKIRDMLKSGEKVWTSAHITLQSNLKQDRISNYETILGKLHNMFDELTKDIHAIDDPKWAFKFMMQMYGFGPFTSYEVVTDLAMMPYTLFDNNTWANAGPGCIPGINLIFPHYKGQEEYMNAMELLRDYQQQAFKKLELPFKKIWHNEEYLNIRNIEHSLCEYRKYWCEQNKVGRPRPRFTPNSGGKLYAGQRKV